jgi:hypothetical protein
MFPPCSMPSFSTIYSLSWRKCPTPLPPAAWQEAQVVKRRQRGRGVEGPPTLIVGSAAAGPDR